MKLDEKPSELDWTADDVLRSLKPELEAELFSIANWWVTHAVDEDNGGFFGEVDSTSSPVLHANKGVVLNCRLLWFFSELAAVATPDSSPSDRTYRAMADRAYEYLINHFLDRENGGCIFEVDHLGTMTNPRKQVYAQAFFIYGLVAYHRLTKQSSAIQLALETFRTIEEKCIDSVHGGYIEAFSRTWGKITDYRLSQIDQNCPKTMNTHLHILEAYTLLHDTVQLPETRDALRKSIALFEQHIFDPQQMQLRLYMDHDWTELSPQLSFGHEIEYSWLTCEACLALDDAALKDVSQTQSVIIARKLLSKATGPNGELSEHEISTQPSNQPSIWWVQAEALVGYANAYQITGDSVFATAVTDVWQFIKTFHKRNSGGEWTWFGRQDANQNEIDDMYLAGSWKAPYHNGRSMMELLRRIE